MSSDVSMRREENRLRSENHLDRPLPFLIILTGKTNGQRFRRPEGKRASTVRIYREGEEKIDELMARNVYDV